MKSSFSFARLALGLVAPGDFGLAAAAMRRPAGAGRHGEITLNAVRLAAVFLFMCSTTPLATAQESVRPLASWPGNGLAQHDFLYAGEWDFRHPDQTMFVVRGGKIVWTYTVPIKSPAGTIQEFSDATMLSNGNVVFAYMSGAMMVSPEKKVLWSYLAPDGFEVHVAQPIGTERVMIVQNGDPATMKLINIATGMVEQEIALPTGNPARAHGHFRRARMTAAGTLLAAHMDNNKVAEYDMSGKEVWALAVLSPWAAVRLRTGNTLVTSNRGMVREFDAKGNIVWEFSQSDVPGLRLFGPQEANRLANGNTVISYWCPGVLIDPKEWPGTVQVIEVTPDKKVVWALSAWESPADLGPATCIQLLDEPGLPELGGQQR